MPMPRKPSLFYRIFHDLYEVKIYQEVVPPRIFYMKEIRRLNNKHFKGTDENGKKVEYKTTEEFDYFVRKLY